MAISLLAVVAVLIAPTFSQQLQHVTSFDHFWQLVCLTLYAMTCTCCRSQPNLAGSGAAYQSFADPGACSIFFFQAAV